MAVAAPAQAGTKGPKKVKEWKSPDEGQGKLAAIMPNTPPFGLRFRVKPCKVVTSPRNQGVCAASP